MRSTQITLIAAAMAVAFAIRAQPSTVAKPDPFLLLTVGEQAHLLNLTEDQSLDQMRSAVRKSRYGQRGLDNIFKNFEGEHFLDPDLPGVRRNIRFLNSPSWQQAKGAKRTLAYSQRIAGDERFTLLALDQPVRAAYGMTDKDLVFEHVATGQKCRIEVKDVVPRSQRSDVLRIKGQIDKMQAEFLRNGELQAWVNRQEVLPEIRKYAEDRGIKVFDKVKQNQFGEVLAHFDSTAAWTIKVRICSDGANVALGILLMIDSGPAAYDDLVSALDPTARSRANLLKFGEHGSLFVSGAAMTTSGASSLAALWTSNEVLLGRLTTLGKWSGRGGFALALATEGFVIWEYMEGQISGRQAGAFTARFAGAVGGAWAGAAAGGAAGAEIGGAIGVWFGGVGAVPGSAIGGVVGSVIGAFSGGWGGSALAGTAADSYFQYKDDKWGRNQRQELMLSLHRHYGAN